jgi:hypothetical protein
MSRGSRSGEPAEATRRANEAQHRGAEAAQRGADGAVSAAGDLPVPPATPPAHRGADATITLVSRNPDKRPQPYWEARVYVFGAELSRTTATSGYGALGGAYAALSAHWLRSEK